MNKVTFDSNANEILSPGLVIAGSVITGTILIIPVVLLSIFQCGAFVVRAGRRALSGQQAEHPAHPGRVSNPL